VGHGCLRQCGSFDSGNENCSLKIFFCVTTVTEMAMGIVTNLPKNLK
jgi:hypothetical protein